MNYKIPNTHPLLFFECSIMIIRYLQRTAVTLPVMPLPKGSLVALVTPMTAEGQVLLL